MWNQSSYFKTMMRASIKQVSIHVPTLVKCLRDRGEKAKTEVGKRRTETGGLSTEKKKDRSSPPGHHRHVSFPPPQQHRHLATISATNASRTREGRKKQRPRALHRGGEEKTFAPPPRIIVISPPSRCPDHLPPPPN